jgi:sporulation protein YlmC with PRC-barrel domain
MNMNYEDRDTYGIYKNKTHKGPGPRLMGADTLVGNDVYNRKGEDLGDIKEIMLDTSNGKVSYAVLSFGGLLGMGEKKAFCSTLGRVKARYGEQTLRARRGEGSP